MRIAVAGGTGTVGRHVMEAAGASGHDPVALSPSTGVDIRTGAGLDAALEGVEVIIDAAGPASITRSKATAFFTEATRRLQARGAAHGVARVVTLSIVGLERVPGYGYYQAKLAQEAAVLEGPLPATIVRATQFHEFPAQILGRTQLGPLAAMPWMRIQPIAARTVGEILVEIATGEDVPAHFEIAGPEPANLVDLARAVLHRRGRRTLVVPFSLPGSGGKAMRGGGQLPTGDVRIAGPTFAEWLGGEDFFALPH